MQEAISTATLEKKGWLSALAARTRAATPTLTDWSAATVSSILLIVSFPDFHLWPLAWIGLVPLLAVVARNPAPGRALLLGWLTGAFFFYGSCHWLTYSLIHYGQVPATFAYLLLVPGAIILGIFPAIFALVLARAIRRWGIHALFLAPIVWSFLEWARLVTTGQLWNAVGYSQAYQPMLIQTARWGGVYSVGFLVITANAAIAFLILKRTSRAAIVAGFALTIVACAIFASYFSTKSPSSASSDLPAAFVVALQPNVPMEPVKSSAEIEELTQRHLLMSESALRQLPNDATPRLLVWPESPMNFAYARDSQLQALLAAFARQHQTAILLNSQEPAPREGTYNSALLINQEGSLRAQYDKIRLLPFGEYVPLPRWLPGASLIEAIVGDFTPGTNYTLMPVGLVGAGAFICIESAYPYIARRFTSEGADVLINISNDGYLGPTAVMRQHLANAVFRAVENGRPLLRITNTGITAYVTPQGEVKDATQGFQPAVRIWSIADKDGEKTFYTKHGDLFVAVCAAITALILAASFKTNYRNRLRG